MAKARAKPNEVTRARLVLEFDRPGQLAGFLLTCLAEPRFARGTEAFDSHLSRIFISRAAPHPTHVRVVADTGSLKLMHQIAEAAGGRTRKLDELGEGFHESSINEFLQRVKLQPAQGKLDIPHTLIALWDADSHLLHQMLLYLTELTRGRCEVAFLQSGSESPSHLIRVHDPANTDAMLTFAARHERRAEVYLPYQSEAQSRFYVQMGYRYPLPGLDRLCDIGSDLVLLRHLKTRSTTQWLTFAAGQVNFFRRFHELADPDLEQEPSAVIQISEAAAPEPVPIKLELAEQQSQTPMRLWHLDRLIDSHRRKLMEMERQRQRVAGGQTHDVFFAYKFEQRGNEQLNPLFVRFCQQRLGVLADYDYAWCAGQGQTPFHLVIARRTQREMGFGMQLADTVFYQPADFRRWGVNLYLPLGRHLVPMVDLSDSVPMLQQLLEKAGSDSNDALLWEQDASDAIIETRVARTHPLLDQYLILNAFQRSNAAQIAEQTRHALIDELRAARKRVAVSCESIEQDLLIYVEGRCSQIEQTYEELHKRIAAADEDLSVQTPRVEKVADFVQNIPRTWAHFVQAVLDLNRALWRDAHDAWQELRAIFGTSREQLQAAALRHRDLAARALRDSEEIRATTKELVAGLGQTQAMIVDTESANEKLYDLFRQIRAAFDKLAKRLAAIAAAQRRINEIEARIDRVDEQEREVARRLKELEPLIAQIDSRMKKLKEETAVVEAKETDAAARLAEVAKAEEELAQRMKEASDHLRKLEVDLQRIVADAPLTRDLFDAIEEEADNLTRRAAVVDRWEQSASLWADFLTTDHRALDDRIDSLRRGELPVTPAPARAPSDQVP